VKHEGSTGLFEYFSLVSLNTFICFDAAESFYANSCSKVSIKGCRHYRDFLWFLNGRKAHHNSQGGLSVCLIDVCWFHLPFSVRHPPGAIKRPADAFSLWQCRFHFRDSLM